MIAWSKLIPSSAAAIVARETPCDAASCLKPSSQRSKLPVLLRQGAAAAGAAIAATASAAKAMERIFPRGMLESLSPHRSPECPRHACRQGAAEPDFQLLPKDVAELWLGPVNVARMKHGEAVRNPGR